MYRRERRMELLKQVEAGSISLDEASRLLSELEEFNDDPPMVLPAPELEPPAASGYEEENRSKGETTPRIDENYPQPSGCWRSFWFFPMVLGVLMIALGAWWLYDGWRDAGLGWRFWLSWIPFMLGVGITVVGWQFQNARWLHLRVKSSDEGKEHNIVFSMPIPFRFIGWLLKTFPRFLPEKIAGQDFETLMDELDKSISAEEPMVIHVDDDKDGDKVDIVIG